MNNLTILLLLKDSSPFTWRWMRYYNQSSLPFKVLIADGGKDKEIEKLRDKSLYQNLDYEYIRYPYDKDMETFFRKICDALGKIETEYTLLASNDDFYLPDSLLVSLKFLEEHRDYVSAREDIYSFEVKSGGNNEIYGEMTNFSKLYDNESNKKETALSRIRESSEFSNSLWHEICRTESLKQSFEAILKSNVRDLELFERMLNYLLIARGKSHRGEGLHMLHEAQSDGLGRMLNKRDIFNWMLTTEWSREVAEMIDMVAEEVAEKDKMAEKDARPQVMQYYMRFIVGNKIKEKVEKDLKNRPGKLSFLSRMIPKEGVIREMLQKIRARKIGKESARIVSMLSLNPEFLKVRDFLAKGEQNKQI